MASGSLNDILAKLDIPDASPIEKLEELLNSEYFEKYLKDWVSKYYEMLSNGCMES